MAQTALLLQVHEVLTKKNKRCVYEGRALTGHRLKEKPDFMNGETQPVQMLPMDSLNVFNTEAALVASGHFMLSLICHPSVFVGIKTPQSVPIQENCL